VTQERAALDSLDGLLAALELTPLGEDRFRADSEPDRFGRIFGGQMIAQAMSAACTTVPDKPPHSLHAYFVQAGLSEQPVEMHVDRVRDGRSMSSRRVTVTQDGDPLLIAMMSFHDNPTQPEFAEPAPRTRGPDELPTLQEWAEKAPPDLLPRARTWIDCPPPVQMRIGEPTYFLGGQAASGPRTHWMRVPRDVGTDPTLHSVLLAYASDYLLLDMAFRSHPERVTVTSFAGSSLDHALWLHRPVRFDRWHRHTQELVAVCGDRGLVRGTIHDIDGHLVANTTQEVLVRVNR
jgi:acyl-CoA thioesterase-2